MGWKRYTATMIVALSAIGIGHSTNLFDVGADPVQRFRTPEGIYAVPRSAAPYLHEAAELYVGRDHAAPLSREMHRMPQRDLADLIGPILADADQRGTRDRLVTSEELSSTVDAMYGSIRDGNAASEALRPPVR